MKSILVLTFLLAIVSFGNTQKGPILTKKSTAVPKLSVKASVGKIPSIAIKASTDVKLLKTSPVLVHKKSSVKPIVKIQKKAGKPAHPKTKKTVKKHLTVDQKVAALKAKVVVSSNKNSAKQQKIRKEKEASQNLVKTSRVTIRKARKEAHSYKLADKGMKYSKAMKKLALAKQTLKKGKKSLNKSDVTLKHIKATLKDNRATMTKITGKKQPVMRLKEHSADRVAV
jgi:hypothetical protein